VAEAYQASARKYFSHGREPWNDHAVEYSATRNESIIFNSCGPEICHTNEATNKTAAVSTNMLRDPSGVLD